MVTGQLNAVKAGLGDQKIYQQNMTFDSVQPQSTFTEVIQKSNYLSVNLTVASAPRLPVDLLLSPLIQLQH